MQHTLYTFRLHRNGVVLFIAGALLFAALIFVAGCLVGRATAPKPSAAPTSSP